MKTKLLIFVVTIIRKMRSGTSRRLCLGWRICSSSLRANVRKMRVSESTAVIETEPAVVEEDSKENELLKEPVGCDEITVTEEAPGIAKARKTLDQLGYVLETDLGKDFQKLQPSELLLFTGNLRML